MSWDWGHIVELAGLVVTILSLHISNVRWATRTRDDVLNRMTGMETKMDLIYGWFKHSVIKGGRSTESHEQS
jgi:hypothetical protein